MKKKTYTKYIVALFVICFAILMIPGIGEILENRAIEKERDLYGDTDAILYVSYYNMKLETDYAVEKLQAMKTGNLIDIDKLITEYDEIHERLFYQINPFARLFVTDVGRYSDFYPASFDDYIYGIGLKHRKFKDMSYEETEKFYNSMLYVYKSWSEADWPEIGDYKDYNMEEDPADLKGKLSKFDKIVDKEIEKLQLLK